LYEKYTGLYPELLENENFKDMRYAILITLSVDNFTVEDYTAAFSYLDRFEEAVAVAPTGNHTYRLKEWIVEAYSRAGSYYYRKGDYTNAKKYLNKGLEYVPGSLELKNKLRNIN
jgi:tetratricopeptide (TPR) repeat protein